MSNGILKIFSHQISPRLLFALDVIFVDILNCGYSITTNKREFQSYEGPKIAYSEQLFENAILIRPEDILFETGIREVEIEVDRTTDIPKLFINTRTPVLGFDIFAATFYLVSRYEEYLPHRTDKHDRYLHTESIAWRYGFLMKPVVNYWAIELDTHLKNTFVGFLTPEAEYKFLPTFDVDDAFFIKYKPLDRIILSLLGSLKNADKQMFLYKWRIINAKETDPYETFEMLIEELLSYKVKPIFFFLMGDYGGFDNAISNHNPRFREIIKAVADHCEVGIHPSYASNSDHNLLNAEIKKLSEILHRPIAKSRQHYLKLKLPGTYQNLINLDILEDYSLVYAGFPGFRAGIASAFYFYDLDYEKKTSLKIYPTCVMDGTFKNYLKFNIEESCQLLIQIIQEVKNVKGVFVPLWHNNSVSDFGEWGNWSRVYRTMIKNAIDKSEQGTKGIT